jgi:hypothetical protein
MIMKALIPISTVVFLLGFSTTMFCQSGIASLHDRVIGCYSAGDRGVTMMRITKKYVQTSNGRQRIPYKVVSSNLDTKTIVFELLAKDRSNFLQKIVTVILQPSGDIIERDYETLKDYETGNVSGRLGFARDRCSTVLRFLK